MKFCNIVGTGNTLTDQLKRESNMLDGFLNALKEIELNYNYFAEITEEDEKKIISLMLACAMKSSNGSLSPVYVAEKAQEYLNIYKK